jgi:hypothetical protein
MTELESELLQHTAELVTELSSAVARLIRHSTATRLTLNELLPEFQEAYQAHFGEGETEAEQLRQRILEKSAELHGLLRNHKDA